ncbi:kinase-like protein [Mycena latifolia]|nr:kinase-like protein [Mycena latifolia]
MIRPFIFVDQDGMEEASRYGPGGLYPVKMGDMFGPDTSAPRYRVLAKLGHGSYSTVWLAGDLIANKTVAVKFVQASDSPDSREAAILECLRAPPGSRPPPVLQILDSFTLTSVNGLHQVLVTEPVLGLERFLELPGVYASMKDLVRQALEGLAFIHSHGIAHGDLHPHNLGVALPELETFSGVQFLQWHGPPDVLPLIPRDPTRDPASFPSYVSGAVDLGDFLLSNVPGFAKRQPQLRILDLGNAYSEPPAPRCNACVFFAAPEVVFPSVADNNKHGPWDIRTDIWSLASTMHEMAGGGPLFDGCGAGRSLLRRMVSLCGGAPENWLQYLATFPDDKPQYTTELADTLWTERAARFMKSGATKEDADGLVKLLRRMLAINPEERPSASELLQDPYFTVTAVDETPASPVLLEDPHPLPRSILVA